MLDNFYIYSDFSMRCIRRTIRDCRPYQSSLLGYRFGRSGSSGFAGGSRRLRWSSCVPVPKVRSCRIVSVGNDGLVFAVVERPFFTEVVAAFEHFAVNVVTVVFVAGYLSVGLAVFDHDVVAVGETAQFFTVASVNGGQIAVAKIDFGKQQPCAAVREGDLAEVV